VSEWKEIPASEYCINVADGTHDTPKPLDIGEYLITSKHIIGGKVDLSNAYMISTNDFEKINLRSKVDKWDVLITMIGTVGEVVLIDHEPNYAIKNIGLFKCGEETKARWLKYYLQSPPGKAEIQSRMGGTTQEYIALGELRKLPIPLPPLPEQKAIASVLSSLDDKIDLLHRQNKTLEAMAETLFRQWFIEDAKEDWETVKTGDYIKTNVSSLNKETALKTIRYLDTGSLTEGKIDSFQRFDMSDAPSRARRIVKHNDVLISTVRPNQKHYGIMKHPDKDVIVSTGFCVITCEKINPHFIYILLTTEEMTEYLHSIAEGSTSTYPSLKPSDIEDLEFQLPPEEILKAFYEYADNAWNKIDYNHIQIRTLEKLRDTLLPKLMSGEVRIGVKNE